MFIMINTAASTSGTDSATTIPVRQPSEIKLTKSTIAKASTKDFKNSPTADCTTFGWSAMRSSSIPTGRFAVKAAVALSTASPSVKILAPFCITMPIPSATLPSL